jgi:hypothetical protein
MSSVPAERLSLGQLTAAQQVQLQARLPPDYPLTQYIEDISHLHMEIDALVEVGSDLLKNHEYYDAGEAFLEANYLHNIYQTLANGNLSHALNIIESIDPAIGYYLPKHLHQQLYESR